jgi:hypothetical protein
MHTNMITEWTGIMHKKNPLAKHFNQHQDYTYKQHGYKIDTHTT